MPVKYPEKKLISVGLINLILELMEQQMNGQLLQGQEQVIDVAYVKSLSDRIKKEAAGQAGTQYILDAMDEDMNEYMKMQENLKSMLRGKPNLLNDDHDPINEGVMVPEWEQ